MTFYQIAMLFSFITACFTLAASWTKNPSRTYWYQVGQCLVYAVAAYFFGVYPCIFMMIINAFRNYLVATQKYTLFYCLLFSILALVLGLWSNTSGIAGLLTIAATIQYSICSFFFTRDITVKLNVVVNLMIWFCYDVLVRDVFSGIMDFAAGILAVITVFRILHDMKTCRNVSGPS